MPTPECAAPETFQKPAADMRPVLFLHIPKCAGTSVVTMLNNLFGEAHARRLLLADPAVMNREIEAIFSDGADNIFCLSGHVPYSFFTPYEEKFRLLTMLRHPVARVSSLFRFLRRHPDLARMGLRRDFGFDEFLASPAGEVFPIIDNAMCRMLSRDPNFHDSATPAPWTLARHGAAVDEAMETLDQSAFGLAEQMANSCALFRHHFGVPFALDAATLNATLPDDRLEDPWVTAQILERNQLDLVLYERAKALFAERLAKLPGSGQKFQGRYANMVFRPDLEIPVTPPYIAGRQGFLDFTEAFSWIDPDAPARLHFMAPAPSCRIGIVLYSLSPDYPVEQIALRLDGMSFGFRIVRRFGHWFQLHSERLSLHNGFNILTIVPPFALPVRDHLLDSEDSRSLSVGIATFLFSQHFRPPPPLHPKLWPRAASLPEWARRAPARRRRRISG